MSNHEPQIRHLGKHGPHNHYEIKCGCGWESLIYSVPANAEAEHADHAREVASA